MLIFLPIIFFNFMSLFVQFLQESTSQPIFSAEAFVSPFSLGSIFPSRCLILTLPAAKDSDTPKGDPDSFFLSFPDKPTRRRSVH